MRRRWTALLPKANQDAISVKRKLKGLSALSPVQSHSLVVAKPDIPSALITQRAAFLQLNVGSCEIGHVLFARKRDHMRQPAMEVQAASSPDLKTAFETHQACVQEPAERLDAGLVASAQAVEHYAMARYGTLKAWATQLGHKDPVKLIDETLAEETKTDKLLTQLGGPPNAAAVAKVA